MKVKSIILAATLLASTTLNAQTLDWVKSFGGLYYEYGNAIGVDASGNIYTAGYFEETVDFNPGSGSTYLTSAGQNDIVVQKMDASGNFLWARSIGGIAYDYATGISLDASGNSYITGFYQVSADFDPGVGTYEINTAGLGDVFVLKLDASGNLVWARSFGGTSNDGGNAITLDASGNIYVTGYFAGTVDFDPGAGTANLTSVGSNDVFVQKMDPSGNFLWAKSFGGNTNDYANSISVDGSGNVYTTGYFGETVDFDPGIGTSELTTVGNTDVFVQKLDASGNFLWARSFGGNSDDASYAISADAAGSVYTAGYFNGLVDLDPGVGTSDFTSVGSNDVFVQKLDASGNFVWARTFGGSFDDRAYALRLDASGNVYTLGAFYVSVDFDPGIGTANLTSNGSTDVFIHKMDPSGNFLWVRSFGGNSDDLGYGIHIDASNTIYTTGGFYSTVDFDPGSGTAYLTAVDGADIFVHKMGQSLSTGLWAQGNRFQVYAYPNPTNGQVMIKFDEPLNDVLITLTDVQGKILYSDYTNVLSDEQLVIEGTAGIYFLNLKTPDGQTVLKLIKE